MIYLGTVSVTDDGYFYETNFGGNTEKISVESAEILANEYIEAHKDAITINEVTLNYIKEEKRLALTSDEQRLFNLCKLFKFCDNALVMLLNDNEYFAIYSQGIYRKSLITNVNNCFMTLQVALAEDFTKEQKKMLLAELCKIYNKSPGELADYIEEQRRPKPPAWPLAKQGMKVKHLPSGDVYIVTKLYEKTWLNDMINGNVYAEPVDTGYLSFTLGDLLKEDPDTSPEDWQIVQ